MMPRANCSARTTDAPHQGKNNWDSLATARHTSRAYMQLQSVQITRVMSVSTVGFQCKSAHFQASESVQREGPILNRMKGFGMSSKTLWPFLRTIYHEKCKFRKRLYFNSLEPRDRRLNRITILPEFYFENTNKHFLISSAKHKHALWNWVRIEESFEEDLTRME